MESNTVTSNRIWQIDFIRGIAIILMIIFHLIVDLKEFYAYNLDYFGGFWYLEGKFSAILFMLICGVSSTLGRSSTLHGYKVFMWSMVLTAVTYVYNENCYILFGILHFLGISLLSVRIMRKLSIPWLLLVSCATILVGQLFAARFVTNPYLFPIGLMTSTFVSMDYYPLFPWYGVFLWGLILGKILSTNKKRLGICQVPRMQLESPTHLKPFREKIIWLGQHSLVVYLIHQPLLLGFLYILLG